MKFWEFESVLRGEDEKIFKVLDEPKWATYLEWHENFDAHVKNQNRNILDAELPDDLCRQALAQSKLKFYIQGDVLKKFQGKLTRRTPYLLLDALEVFDRFGGSSIEEVLEFGSSRIK